MFEEAVRVVCSEAARLYHIVWSAKQDLKNKTASSSLSSSTATNGSSSFVVLRAVAKMTVFGTCDLTRAVAVAIDSPQAAISAATRQGLKDLCQLSESMAEDDPRGKIFVCWLSLEDLHNKGVVGQSTYIIDAVRAEQGPLWEGEIESGHSPAPVKEAHAVGEVAVTPRVRRVVTEEVEHPVNFEPVPVETPSVPSNPKQEQQQQQPPQPQPAQGVPLVPSNQQVKPAAPSASILDNMFTPLSANSSFQQPSPRLSFLSSNREVQRRGEPNSTNLDDTTLALLSAPIPDLGIAVLDDGSLELVNLANSLQRAMQMINTSLIGAQRQLQMVASTSSALERERCQIDTVLQLVSSLGKGVEAIEERVAMMEKIPVRMNIGSTTTGTQCSLLSSSVETQTEPVVVMHVNGSNRVVGTPHVDPIGVPERCVSPLVPSRRNLPHQRHGGVNLRLVDNFGGVPKDRESFAAPHRAASSLPIAPPGALMMHAFSQHDGASSPSYFKVSPPQTPLAQFDTRLSHRHAESAGPEQTKAGRRRLYAFSPPSLAINSQRGDVGEFSSMATFVEDEGHTVSPNQNSQLRVNQASTSEREDSRHHIPETLEEWLEEDALRLLPQQRYADPADHQDQGAYEDPHTRGGGAGLSVWDMLERDRKLEMESERLSHPTFLYAPQQRQSEIHVDLEGTDRLSVASPSGNVAAEWSDAHRLVMARRQQQQQAVKDPPPRGPMLIPMTDDLRAGPGLLPARRTGHR